MRTQLSALALISLAAAASAQPAPDGWVTPPTAAQIAAAYPERAKASHVDGAADVHCSAVSSLGELEGCVVVSATPAGWGFGEAAIGLAAGFRVATAGPPDHQRPGGGLTFDIRFTEHPETPVVADGPAWTVKTWPGWYVMPTNDDMAWAYPDRALRKNLSGKTRMRCVVETNGRLAGCTVVFEDPPDQGFGAAAIKLARKFTLRPMTLDGAPVVGGAIVPVAFQPQP